MTKCQILSNLHTKYTTMKTYNQMFSHLNRQSINKPQLLFLLFAVLAFTLTAFTRPVVYSSTCHFST